MATVCRCPPERVPISWCVEDTLTCRSARIRAASATRRAISSFGSFAFSRAKAMFWRAVMFG